MSVQGSLYEEAFSPSQPRQPSPPANVAVSSAPPDAFAPWTPRGYDLSVSRPETPFPSPLPSLSKPFPPPTPPPKGPSAIPFDSRPPRKSLSRESADDSFLCPNSCWYLIISPVRWIQFHFSHNFFFTFTSSGVVIFAPGNLTLLLGAAATPQDPFGA